MGRHLRRGIVGHRCGTGAVGVGVALGSLTWVSVLACGVAAARRAAGPRTVQVADAVAALGLVTFGGVLGWRTVTSGALD